VVGIGSANTDPRNENLDSNNVVFVDLNGAPQVVARIRSYYLGGETDAGSLHLPWSPIDPNYVRAALDQVKKTKPWLLQALRFNELIGQQ
jgi:hypothetical protein